MGFSVRPVVIRAAVVGITMCGRVPALRPAMERRPISIFAHLSSCI